MGEIVAYDSQRTKVHPATATTTGELGKGRFNKWLMSFQATLVAGCFGEGFHVASPAQQAPWRGLVPRGLVLHR